MEANRAMEIGDGAIENMATIIVDI